MRLILSPAKTMRMEDAIAPETVPVYLSRAEELVQNLKRLSAEERRRIWNCSEKLAMQNEERLAHMNLGGDTSPAVFSYSGLAYSHLSPESLSDRELAYLQGHLRILSGLYGILKPLDGIVPYRLEFQAKLKTAHASDLYAFWGDLLYRDLFDGEDTVIDLASEEYSRAVTPYVNGNERMIHIVFAERSKGTLKTKGTFAKMARGDMTRWLAEEAVNDPEDIRKYTRGYVFSEADSDPLHYCFVKTAK